MIRNFDVMYEYDYDGKLKLSSYKYTLQVYERVGGYDMSRRSANNKGDANEVFGIIRLLHLPASLRVVDNPICGTSKSAAARFCRHFGTVVK